MEDFAETPVIFETKEYGEVNSYGIAFTPLFLCIGLWVGALMCYVIFYYDHENRFGILGINSKNKLLQNVIYLAIGAVEGLITGFLLKMGRIRSTKYSFILWSKYINRNCIYEYNTIFN